jgi:hypothetical protein
MSSRRNGAAAATADAFAPLDKEPEGRWSNEMAVTSLESFRSEYQKREERQSEVVQVKFTPSEMAELDHLVQWMRTKGTNATRSGVVRALVVDSLVAFREEVSEA